MISDEFIVKITKLYHLKCQSIEILIILKRINKKIIDYSKISFPKRTLSNKQNFQRVFLGFKLAIIIKN